MNECILPKYIILNFKSGEQIMNNKDYGFFGLLKEVSLNQVLGDVDIAGDDVFAAALPVSPGPVAPSPIAPSPGVLPGIAPSPSPAVLPTAPLPVSKS